MSIQDWEHRFGGTQLTCIVTGVEIPPGENFYSALEFVDNQYVRRQYSVAVWNDEFVARSLCWWRQRRPLPEDDNKPVMDLGAILQIFRGLGENLNREQQCFAWIITWLLVRARRLRYIDLVQEGSDTFLVVKDVKLKRLIRLRDPRLAKEEEAKLQESLETLFTVPAAAAVEMDES